MGRLTRPIPTIPDLPPPLPRMGTGRCAGPSTTSTSPRLGRAGRDRLVRVFHRRHLRGGEKGGLCVGKTRRGKGTKIMVITDGSSLPLAIHVESAAPHEVTLVQDTLQASHVRGTPHRLVGDKAYDSDPLDAFLKELGIDMIAPHRANRAKPKTQDGRKLRRYKRRWKVERFFAWLQNFRKVAVRYERHLSNFAGFVKLGCIVIFLRNYF
jgi:transposase